MPKRLRSKTSKSTTRRPRSLASVTPEAPLAVVGTSKWRETVPKHLQTPLANALRAMEANDLAGALQWFGECAEIDPFSKPVLYFGGQVAAQGYFSLKANDHNNPNLPQWRDVAETLVRAAYEVAPDDAVACHNVGRFLQDVGEEGEAIQYYRHTLLLDSTQVETYGNLGTALYQRGDVDEAWTKWRKATDLSPRHASGELSQSYIWLRQGEYAKGWKAFQARWRDPSFQQNYGRQKELGGIHWDGSDLPDGHALLLHGEQGLGDHVQFARYARLLKDRGVNVVGLETRATLKRWMAAAFPDIPIYARDIDAKPEFTHHCSTMDLPALLGTTVETVPPPSSPVEISGGWKIERSLLQCEVVERGGLAVGIAWEGAKGNPADSLRSIPHECLSILADIPGVTWVSLQFAPDASIVGRAWLGKHFVDGTEGCADVLDTAAVKRAQDLIICVDTLTAHLAGTLGIPTWVLHRFCREWRWLDQGESAPWYPSVRSLTCPAPNDWTGLLTRVRAELEATAHA